MFLSDDAFISSSRTTTVQMIDVVDANLNKSLDLLYLTEFHPLLLRDNYAQLLIAWMP